MSSGEVLKGLQFESFVLIFADLEYQRVQQRQGNTAIATLSDIRNINVRPRDDILYPTLRVLPDLTCS